MNDAHLVGPEFGPTGLILWQFREARALATRPDPPADWQAQLLTILNTQDVLE